MTIADRLERFFTKRAGQKTPLTRWQKLFAPSLLLQPEERYSVGLYLRETAIRALPAVVIVLIFFVLSLVDMWHQSPPPSGADLLHFLLHRGIPLLLGVQIIFMLFIGVLRFPFFTFWNRRAARLQRQPKEPLAADADPTVWPPAPTVQP